ncbi:MAG TPA: glycosyltransferase family 2 protein [Candidatus Absconditabacterales bacterium]|nr:glycosyltransferase family 2 protein [Candidatus Absconditabacterales bacterium]HNG97424.1 glycosyltransferase family 2 protein [Candidatus Absconditabacterales bacterium]
MSLLTVLISTAAILFLIIGRDAYKRGKINFLHGLIFVGGSLMVGYSLYDASFLTSLGSIFGLARGADILIYGAILVLTYFYFEILNKQTKDTFIMSKFITNEALSHIDESFINDKVKTIHAGKPHTNGTHLSKGDFMFHIKGLNESKTIGHVIDQIIDAGFSKILIVNDGSTDGMDNIVRKKIEQYPHVLIVLVNHLINRRHGAGNKTGIAFFRKFGALCHIKYVVFFDSDGQMNIDDMSTFMSYLEQHPNVDVIQGSRFVSGGTASNIPWTRKIILRGAKLITYIFNGIAITDSHNGYKCFKLHALQQINLTTDSTMYANELIDEYKRLKLHVVELPVHINYSDYSLGKGQKNSNAFNILFEMIYRKLFFR